MDIKKIISVFIVILSIFLVSRVSLVKAQDLNSMLVPGINCGNVEQPYNHCCYFEQKNTVIKSVGIPVLDPLISLISSAADSVFKPVFDPLNRITQSTVQPCIDGEPSTPGNLADPSCTCKPKKVSPLTALAKLCDSTNEKTQCYECLNNGGVWSAIGCVYADLRRFIQDTLLGFGIGLAGIVALLCIIFSAIQLQTSAGNPEKIKKSQELMTSCITGLILIIFSVFILRLIGVNILKIPGFR